HAFLNQTSSLVSIPFEQSHIRHLLASAHARETLSGVCIALSRRLRWLQIVKAISISRTRAARAAFVEANGISCSHAQR
ncbi:MAG: hypothetical protein WCK55_20310, partial [Verrucomicrobiota bacterium]